MDGYTLDFVEFRQVNGRGRVEYDVWSGDDFMGTLFYNCASKRLGVGETWQLLAGRERSPEFAAKEEAWAWQA